MTPLDKAYEENRPAFQEVNPWREWIKNLHKYDQGNFNADFFVTYKGETYYGTEYTTTTSGGTAGANYGTWLGSTAESGRSGLSTGYRLVHRMRELWELHPQRTASAGYGYLQGRERTSQS